MVEVLVALVILAVGLLGLMALEVMTIRRVADSKERQTATLLAKGMLDQVQAEAQIEHLRAYNLNGPRDFVSTYNNPKGTVTFDKNGKPTADAKEALFTANWGRIASKGGTPGTAEYVVEVTWVLETAANGTPIPLHVSMNRLITY